MTSSMPRSSPDVVTLPTLDIGEYDPWSDTIMIEGTRYSGGVFREGFGIRAQLGQKLRIDRREADGCIIITRLPD